MEALINEKKKSQCKYLYKTTLKPLDKIFNEKTLEFYSTAILIKN